jgi:CRISPR/Cas system CSM-associated protein Csm5 (group 7 of RAMP superfamily)
MEVLTPWHVGVSCEKDWVQGSDFVVHDGKVKILNLQKASKYININDLTTALLKKDGKTLTAKLGSNLNNCVEKVFEETYVGSNDIKTCIKNGLTNKPIVPGSSLKGAIRQL